MPMTRGTALVATVARVVQLTGQQDLANLETGSELTLTELLVEASDAIYDQLEALGVDPTTLTNQLVYERAVAWYMLGNLAMLGYLEIEGKVPPETPFDWSDPFMTRVRPKTSGDDPVNARSSVPVFMNFDSGFVYGSIDNTPREPILPTSIPRKR